VLASVVFKRCPNEVHIFSELLLFFFKELPNS
jgi:hypothetical protein